MAKKICTECQEMFEEKYFNKKQNKCILHCNKDDWYSLNKDGSKNWDKSEWEVRKFWIQIRKELNTYFGSDFYEDFIKEKFIYERIIFPKFEKETPYLNGLLNVEEQGTNFYYFGEYQDERGERDLGLNNIIDKLDIEFHDCTFLDDANFLKYKFEKRLEFYLCKFESNFILPDEINTQLFIDNCYFGKDVLLKNKII